jgi:soluble lytic murein transglycosylase
LIAGRAQGYLQAPVWVRTLNPVRFRARGVFAVGLATALCAPHAGWASARGDDDDSDVRPAPGASPSPSPSPSTAASTAAKPTPFDPTWIEPFFKGGAGKQAVEHFRAEEWDAAAAGFSRAVKALPRASVERRAARYLLALTLANQSRWAEAGALFEELYTSYPQLAVYHAYNAARCRLRRGDAAGALDWAARVPKGAIPEAEAILIDIDALRALGRWDDALATLQGFLDRFPAGPRRAEALFKKGEALERLATEANDTTADATAAYRRVWAEAPLEAWADRASERIAALARALPAAEANLVRTRTASEWVTRGMALFDANRNVESEAAFAAALSAAALDRDLECRARFHRAQSVWKQRQRSRAAPLFDEAEPVCARAENRDLHAKALYQAGRCYASMNDRAGATLRYARIEAEHGDHSYADDARLRAAELAADAGDDAEVTKLLTEVPVRYPKGDLVNEALWRLAFAAWRQGRYDDALHWLDENLRLIPHEEIWYAEGRALYWKGRIFDKQSKPELARTSYERAVRDYPLSVYALLSLDRLKEQFPKARDALVSELRERTQRPVKWSFTARALFADPGFLRAVELARMGQGADARRELARLGLSTVGEKHPSARALSEDEDLLWITAILLDRGGVWSASHSIPRYVATRYRTAYPREMGAAKWKIAYPRAFPALVSKNARANQIPEALQLAIMREESAFNPRIESFANAIGLTQMLIKTARRFSNNAPVTREVLMDPARNLEMGSRFLGFLWRHFNAAAPLAIAGYNAGEGAVDRWLNEHGDLAVDEFMETIPFDETRNYTKRVLASYFAYSWLYFPQPVPELPAALPAPANRAAPPPRTADKRG